MSYTSKEIFDFMRKTSLTQSQVTAFYTLLEQGADINTIASFIGMQDKESQSVSKYKLSERSLKATNCCSEVNPITCPGFL